MKSTRVISGGLENTYKFIEIVQKLDKEKWDILKKFVDEYLEEFIELDKIEEQENYKRVQLIKRLDNLK